jgi:hypothetical protein
MRFYQILPEKRRNATHPNQKRIGAIEQLAKYADRDDIYISFTFVDKIGINPGSTYETPLGIYTYPLRQMWKNMKKEGRASNVPFAGDEPVINIVQSNNVMELSEYNAGDLNQDLTKINLIIEKLGFDQNTIKTTINSALKNARIKNPGGKFWYITKKIAILIAKKKNSKPAIVWNWLFRQLGYNGISDKTGQGIIHTNEGIQAVFFTKDSFRVLDRISNKELSLRHRVLLSTTEEEQLALVSQDWRAIQFIKNPSEVVQLAAVNKNGLAIPFIKNPSEVVQLAAVNKNGTSIQFINNPSEAVQLAAITNHIYAINLIKNPSQKAIAFHKQLWE